MSIAGLPNAITTQAERDACERELVLVNTAIAFMGNLMADRKAKLEELISSYDAAIAPSPSPEPTPSTESSLDFSSADNSFYVPILLR